MWLFLFQFFLVAVVLGTGAGLALRNWDRRKPFRDESLLAKVATENGFTVGAEVQPGVVSKEFQDKLNILGK